MRQNTLIARSQAAKAKKAISQSFAGVGSDAFSKFDQLERKVEKTEAEAEAFAQLAGENTSLEDQFKALGAGSEVDDELAALFDAHTMDVLELIRQAIVLQTPIAPRCSDECPGLPEAANYHEERDERWGALEKWKLPQEPSQGASQNN